MPGGEAGAARKASDDPWLPAWLRLPHTHPGRQRWRGTLDTDTHTAEVASLDKGTTESQSLRGREAGRVWGVAIPGRVE